MASEVSDDLLLGAKAIAEWFGPHVNERKVYYWAGTKRFSIFRIGDQLAARKSSLLKDLARLEGEGEAA